MINRVVLVGRLTKDPELRYTPSGVPMARFTVAVNRPFSNQQGEKEADFIGCIAWRKQAENLANFMRKGSLIGVEGRIQTGSYEGQDGKRVYVTEVVAESVQFLEPRGSNGGNRDAGSFGAPPRENNYPSYGGQNQNQNQQRGGNYTRVDDDPFANGGQTIDISDDDLPF